MRTSDVKLDPRRLVTSIAAIMLTGAAATGAHAADPAPVLPGGSVCPWAGNPGAVAVLNLTPVEAGGAGFGAVRASNAPTNNSLGAEAVSNVNFRIGSVDPNVAFTAIGSDGRVCFDNSPHASTHLVADQMGVLAATSYAPAAASGAKRLVDTRRGFVEGGPAAGALVPGGSVCPVATGEPGRVAVVNITPLEATGAGFGAVRASSAPSNNSLGDQAVSNVNFSVGSVDPNLAFAVIGADGRICFDNSPHATVHLLIDQMGSLPSNAFAPAAVSGGVRLIDTRAGIVTGGIVVTSVVPGASVCARAIGNPGDVAVLNGTPIDASGPGFMAVRSSAAPSNNTLGDAAISNWNFGVGSVDPNVAFAEIGPDGQICIDNSPHSTVQMVLDQAGYLSTGTMQQPTAGGARRLVDTRRGFVSEPPGQGPPTAPYGLVATPEPGKIALAWSAPTDDGGASIDRYVVERAIGTATQWEEIAQPTASGHTDLHLSPAVVYFYRVRAHNIAGWGPPSLWVSASPATPVLPGPVQQLTGLNALGSAMLSWQPPADDGGASVVGFNVEARAGYCSNPGGVVALWSLGLTTQHTATSLTNGQRYCILVRARTSAGQGASSAVEVVPGRPNAPTPCSIAFYSEPQQDGSVDWILDVTWSTPASDGGWPIGHYTVTVYYDNGFDAVTVAQETLPADARYTSRNDLLPEFWPYAAWVTAVNSLGGGMVCATGTA